MTNTELDAFRRVLQSKQAEFGNGNRNQRGLAIETSPEELDRIQHANERDCTIDCLERNSNLLRDVRSALGRINAGAYSICVGCEDNINPKRLAAIPWASSCIVCQEASEKTSRRQVDALLLMVA
jgi:DnaK suppressor protein